jgi:hypothetical protein
MKRLPLLALSLIVVACASSSPDAQKAKAQQPDVDFVQLVGPADLGYPPGSFDVQYGVRVQNPSSDAITLRRIAVETVGGGGPYALRRDTYYFTDVIPAQNKKDVAFWAHAIALGNAGSADAQAFVTIRAIAYFDTPTGMVRKVVMKNFGQMGR